MTNLDAREHDPWGDKPTRSDCLMRQEGAAGPGRAQGSYRTRSLEREA